LNERVLQRKHGKHHRPCSHYQYPRRDLPHFAPLKRAALARESSQVQPRQAGIEDKISGGLRIVGADVSVHISEGQREAHTSRERPSSCDIYRGKSQHADDKCNHAILPVGLLVSLAVTLLCDERSVHLQHFPCSRIEKSGADAYTPES
jgi:hypothetical protein